MPSLERGSNRIVIAGASSLLGAEVRSLLEESRFAGAEFRLVDEELAAGTLTEAGGEPAVIQPVEEGSFEKARIIFFTGSSDFTLANFETASRAGAVVIDLSGHSISFANTFVWYSGLEKLRGQTFPEKPHLAAVPSAAAEGIIRLSLALREMDVKYIVVTVLQPVSAAGKGGIEELETQTKQLLSFQGPGKELFDAQVAFSSLDRFGPQSRFDLNHARLTLRNEIGACLRGEGVLPTVQLVHVPVFYGVTFAACAKLADGVDEDGISEACQRAGFAILDESGIGPNNISAAGETVIQLSKPKADQLQPGSWWFWGAADNIRLPAWNAVKLAEKLVA
ncbi:MAG TPA: Asd/ArgC dimerization domain-containing protein [Candidatus Acidoferrum sp.]|nr:Asd/ArgC dimerization domain-containing protein [Candidatus Acidoferrum sp.]